MEVYVKMTDEELENYKAFKKVKTISLDSSIEEILLAKGFSKDRRLFRQEPITGARFVLTYYRDGNTTVTVEIEATDEEKQNWILP